MMSATLAYREIGTVVIMDIGGRITLGDGATVLKNGVKGLLNKGKYKIILNLADVTYIDPSGIGELVSGFTTASNKGGSLKLLNLTKRVQDLLQITKLHSFFEVFDEEAEAVASFN